MKLKEVKYPDILAAGGGIHSTMNSTKDASFEELYEKGKKSLNTMLSFGVTTVEGKSGYGIDDLDTEIRQLEVAHKLNENHPVDVISTFIAAHSIPKQYKDEGPFEFNAKSGATITGSRFALIAFNINLDTKDLVSAKKVVKAIRDTKGGYKNVRAIALEIPDKKQVQISMNLVHY